MENNSDGIALLCTLYPNSLQARERILELLKNNLPYYRSPRSHCTSWTYFTPIIRQGDTNTHSLPDGTKFDYSGTSTTVILGFETYTRKSALQQQIDDPVYFQKYHKTVKDEKLYTKEEELVAWYFAGGFLAREEVSESSGQSIVVVAAQGTMKEGKEKMGQTHMINFANYVETTEPDTLTYAVYTRPKAPREIFVLERYTNKDAFEKHKSTGEFKRTFDLIFPAAEHANVGQYNEVEGSFVGNVVGGVATLKDKAESKL